MSDAVNNRISPEQREQFNALLELGQSPSQLSIIHAKFEGKPVTVVTHVVYDNEKDDLVFVPLAIMMNEDIASRLGKLDFRNNATPESLLTK